MAWRQGHAGRAHGSEGRERGGSREGQRGLMGRGGCGAVLLSGHSLASVSAEPASHMSVGLLESEEG